jgi:hypothetical protein
MLSSFADATSPSSSSPYETPPTWWKSNFTSTTFCAALSTAFFPSPVPLPKDISPNIVEKRPTNTDHHHQCEY